MKKEKKDYYLRTVDDHAWPESIDMDHDGNLYE